MGKKKQISVQQNSKTFTEVFCYPGDKAKPLACGMYFVNSFQRVHHREEVRMKISSNGDESCYTHNQDDVPKWNFISMVFLPKLLSPRLTMRKMTQLSPTEGHSCHILTRLTSDSQGHQK